MTLINASLIAGAVFAALPVLLHMIMKAKPKRIEFPALRLLQTRQTSNSRRMRIRHLLLLILRSLVVVLAVLALARPSLPAARYGLRWYEWSLLLAVVCAGVGIFLWRDRRLKSSIAAEHIRREKRTTWKAVALLGSLVAVLIAVGIPWGFRVRSEMTAPVNAMAAELPVAAVFLFDTSASMTFKQEGKTRLEEAQQIGLDQLKVLPGQSRVAITTTNPNSESVFQADLAGVRSRIEALKFSEISRPLNAVLKNAIEEQVADRELVQQQGGLDDSFVREIYLLTDSSVSAWKQPDESSLSDLLVQYDWLQIYFIDVGVDNPANVALTELKLDIESTVADQPVTVSVAVSGTAAASDSAVVELFTLDESGDEVRGGGVIGSPRRSVTPDQTAPVISFQVKGNALGQFTSGVIRLSSPDPLTIDDTRYFSFRVSAVPNVLLVGDRDLDITYLENVLNPQIERLNLPKRFNVKAVLSANFQREALSNYDIVCVMNWQRPSESSWSNLLAFVRAGGRLLISAGGEQMLQEDSWRTPDTGQLLPGLPLVPVRFRPQPARIELLADDHPIVNAFNDLQLAKTELNRAIFDRCWTFDVVEDARELLRFNHRNAHPALLERQVGRGKVLLFTSALDSNGNDLWNESFVIDNWTYLMFVDEIMRYLSGASETKHNFEVGDPIEVDVPVSQRFSQFMVARPRFRQTRGQMEINDASILLTDADEAGHYELNAAEEGQTFRSVFAVNVPDKESNLAKVTDKQLNEILGEDRYSRVKDLEQLDRAVNLGRLGVEVFPVLMGLLLILFCGEHLMANFFYDDEPVDAAA